MATKKLKPRLHLVKGGGDPGLYDADIDWFYGVYDYECGLKSIGEMKREIDEKMASGGTRKHAEHDDRTGELKVKVSKPMCVNPDLYTDHHVTWSGEGVFTKGRRIWRRLQLLSFATREILRKVYEPRQYFPEEWLPPTEDEIRAAHAEYRGVT
jgi:hypothetical protein